jgi:hypothetical protein
MPDWMTVDLDGRMGATLEEHMVVEHYVEVRTPLPLPCVFVCVDSVDGGRGHRVLRQLVLVSRSLVLLVLQVPHLRSTSCWKHPHGGSATRGAPSVELDSLGLLDRHRGITVGSVARLCVTLTRKTRCCSRTLVTSTRGLSECATHATSLFSKPSNRSTVAQSLARNRRPQSSPSLLHRSKFPLQE